MDKIWSSEGEIIKRFNNYEKVAKKRGTSETLFLTILITIVPELITM